MTGDPNRGEDVNDDYDSGPFCRHWSDPGECEHPCTCGHTCAQHDLDGECQECDCAEQCDDEEAERARKRKVYAAFPEPPRPAPVTGDMRTRLMGISARIQFVLLQLERERRNSPRWHEAIAMLKTCVEKCTVPSAAAVVPAPVRAGHTLKHDVMRKGHGDGLWCNDCQRYLTTEERDVWRAVFG